jgi:hypothetical protein
MYNIYTQFGKHAWIFCIEDVKKQSFFSEKMGETLCVWPKYDHLVNCAFVL